MLEDTLLKTGIGVMSEPVKKAITSLYEHLKNASTSYIEKWRNEKGIEELYQHVEIIRQVKTIWQIDKSVDLREFYVPPHVKNYDKSRTKITDINSLKTSKPVLLEGVAGQGKSTLMRYLCSKEMVEGDRIPIFIELRRIKLEESIIEHISKYLEILGLSVNRESFLSFLKQGKISLYLDGFDEVAESIKQRVIAEIEEICLKQINCMILITSRPYQSIKSLACLDVVRLDNLIKDEYKEVIYKISENRDYADALIKVVESHKRDLKGILCTPLLVTLLVISYKSYQQIPDHLSDFYDSLFKVLLQRHDGTKPAYARPRITKLNDSKFREAFETFCFLTKKIKKQIFSLEEIIMIAQEALERSNISASPDDFIVDIFEVTCLLVKEGDEWQFIHKSIQEYFCSSHIKTRPEIKSQQIYAILGKGYKQNWLNELKFLSEIDEYRFGKYFFIPNCRKILGYSNITEHSRIKTNMSLVKSILGCYKLELMVEENNFTLRIGIEESLASPLHDVVIDVPLFLFTQVKHIIKDNESQSNGLKKIDITIDINSLMKNKTTRESTTKYVENITESLVAKAKYYEDLIRRAESEPFEGGLFN
jgi:hypothetical protein